MRAIGLRTTPANASVSKASNANKVVADVGGNLNVASVQDTTVSQAHQSSAGGGFTISQTGGGASFSAQNGHADGNYAGVKEQAGIQAGSGGFDVTVKGNTDLKGAYIGSTADPSKNSLTTGTLTTSDIENHSHYSANSAGFSAGASVGPSSVSGAGGVTPMVFQNDSGDQSATTKSAVSAGTINITKPGEQTQDVANLNRDDTCGVQRSSYFEYGSKRWSAWVCVISEGYVAEDI